MQESSLQETVGYQRLKCAWMVGPLGNLLISKMDYQNTRVLGAAEFTQQFPKEVIEFVRGTDKTGQIQTSEVRPPFPD